MPRRALVVFLVVFAAGVAVLVLAAAADHRRLAFTLSVLPSQVAAVLEPGDEACVRHVDVEAGFDRAQLTFGTFRQAGPPLSLRVLDAATGAQRAAGSLPGGYADGLPAEARLAPAVRAPGVVDVCVRNAGSRRVALYGGLTSRRDPAYATLNGARLPLRVRLALYRPSRSALSLVPRMFERAALFHPRWVGAWTFWALLALVLVVAPALVCAAIARAARPPDLRS
jgi:hypothetical protein